MFVRKASHLGVLGIVASRLVERFRRPVFVLSEDTELGIIQGSGRSIPAFHLLEALESMPELFIRFGGHRQAAGLTLSVDRLSDFRKRLEVYAAARLSPADFVPVFEVDAEVELREITDRAAAGLRAMEPFGHGNPCPVFAVLGAEVVGAPAVWRERHLQVNVRQNGRTLLLKAWQSAERAAELPPGARVDVLLSVDNDSYLLNAGGPGWCAVLKDVRPSLSK